MRILIQCGDNLENTRRVLALASLFRRAGHRPLIGVYTEDYAAPFKTMGFEVVALRSFVPMFVGLRPERELGFLPSLRDLLPLENSKAQLYGEDDVDRWTARATVAHLLAGKRALDECGAEALVVWNGVTGHFANALRCLKAWRRLPGGFIERGLISDGVFFDSEGTNGWSSTARGVDLGTHTAREERRERHLEALHAHFPSLHREIYIGRAKVARSKRIFVPLQVQSDSNILLHSQHIKTMRQLVIVAISLRDQWFPDYEILVRPHPEEQPDEILNLPRTRRLHITSKGDLNEILADSQITVTVNSTVGLEAALYGNLPIVCGDSIYGNEPFVIRHRPGANEDPTARLLELRNHPERVWEQVSDFMIALLDRNLVQPLKNSSSDPKELLNAFTPTERIAPLARMPVLEQARRVLEQLPGPVHCHVLTSNFGLINLDYRRLQQTPRFSDIDRMLKAILEIDKPFVARRGEWSSLRHVAIADTDISPSAISGYMTVLTPNFGIHPAMLQKSDEGFTA